MRRYTRYVRALTTAFCLSGLVACSPLVVINGLVPDSGYTRETGIQYGARPRQKLDVYRPAKAMRPKAVIVFFYGGSWKWGERRHYRFVGQALASRGYLVVIPDYRLYPEVEFPGFVEDAAAAIKWVHREIPARGGDPDRIVLAGHSAGAHIAALVALDRAYLRDAAVPHSSIAGWVGLAGPYAFDPLKFARIRPIFESAPDPNAARPITFVRRGAPPALLLHGSADRTVGVTNSRQLARRLKSAGVPLRYDLFDGVGHSGILLALAKPFEDKAPVLARISTFVDGLKQDSGRSETAVGGPWVGSESRRRANR